MKKMLQKLRHGAAGARDRATALVGRMQGRLDQLTAEPEAGLEDSAWKAIWIVSGATVAIGLVALVSAWLTGYIGKLPG